MELTANKLAESDAVAVAAVVNASARLAGADCAAWLSQWLRNRYGIEAQIFLAETGAEMRSYARRAAKGSSDLVIAAGGDGTVSSVAAQLVGTDKRLGVLPFGTLNHFAKDLHIPLDAEAAARNFIEGRPLRVDTASVNGQWFLNNSSLGLYPQAVAAREQQQKSGWNKWLAWLPALWSTLRRYPVMAVRLTADNHESVRRTAIVFIGNNRYTLEGPGIGSRSGLEDGTLHVSIMRRCGVWAMLRLFTYALLGKLQQIREFDSLSSKELWIDSRRKQLAVALDGEVTRLRPPLHYRIHPASLTVMVPHA